VVVVEAPDRSGALLTVAAAIDYGREVFAVPGPIDAIASRGCNRLIADHQATIVTSAAGLLHRIGTVRGTRPVSVKSLSDAETGRALLDSKVTHIPDVEADPDDGRVGVLRRRRQAGRPPTESPRRT